MKFLKGVLGGAAAVVVASLLSGCMILAPIIDSVQRAGITESGRRGVLANTLKDYHQALYWQRPEQALAWVRDDKRDALTDQFLRNNKEQRLVESKVEYINWGSNSFDAKVNVLAKYYKTPYYIVHERIEKQQWEFSLTSGWRLVSIETADAAS